MLLLLVIPTTTIIVLVLTVMVLLTIMVLLGPNYNRASATTNYNRAITNYKRTSGVFHPAANGARCESMLQVEAFAHVWVVDMIDF